MIKRRGTTIDKEIHSKYLKETKTLTIYTPENYSNLYKYNICIMLNGNDYYQSGHISTLSDQFHHERKISNTIFVGIQYKDKNDRHEKYYPEDDNNEAYTKFLVSEVVAYLDALYPTYQMGQTRILLGNSFASTFALTTALRFPHTFGKVILQSPFVNERVIRHVEKTNKKSLQLIDIYHTIGENEKAVLTPEGQVIDFITSNRQLSKYLQEKGSTYYYKEINFGEHTWDYWQKDLPNALLAMLAY